MSVFINGVTLQNKIMPKSNQPRQSGLQVFYLFIYFLEVEVEYEVEDGGMEEDEDGEEVGYNHNTYMKFSVN